ncbi:substrate-binding periplasmic protein [Emcibacter nanhaiensis]|uniref:Amino acid ABC transporter substrate-binding protein n=1 Tax=Emcibacter nanhaiensis TaxID=1505037 RepID=A0A501PS90_9PROT|nr:transporter substrate-binding domain-containing protein [Emcibacter nanhaiensis]TPD62656.1 amino acid ABC transporter substrate-binding protein [Emcibacter nanhaiensis]
MPIATVFRIFLILLAGVIASSSVRAEDKGSIVIYSLDIEGLIGNSKGSKYNTLLDRVSRETGLNIILKAYPGNRLMREFEKSHGACLFPDYRAPEGQGFIFTVPFNQALGHLVTLKKDNGEPLRGIDGLRVGIVNGYGYDFTGLDKAASLVGVETERQNLNLLLFGRVEAILSYFPDLPLVATAEEMDQLIFDEKKPVFTAPERFACVDTPENRRFLKQFDAVVARLYESGELRDILSPFFYGLPEQDRAH